MSDRGPDTRHEPGEAPGAESIQSLASKEVVEQALGSSALARGLTAAQVAQLASLGRVRQYREGDLICDEFEQSDELYVIARGTVEAWIDPSLQGNHYGALRRINTLAAGQICGEVAMLDQGVRSAQLLAGREGATLIVFARQDFLGLCEADPVIGYHVMFNIAATLAHRLRLRR